MKRGFLIEKKTGSVVFQGNLDDKKALCEDEKYEVVTDSSRFIELQELLSKQKEEEMEEANKKAAKLTFTNEEIEYLKGLCSHNRKV